jgi:ribosomal protein RSM22 (predicted rRNA methylase)
MPLPECLKFAIEEKISKIKLRELVAASQNLSHSYRHDKKKNGSFMSSSQDHLAYLSTRFPATFAANCHVFKGIRELMTGLNIESLLDVGAGPGTGMWAASEIFPRLKRATLIEKDTGLIELGKSLPTPSNLYLQWQEKDLEKGFIFEPHDLVLLSYSLGELSEKVWETLLEKLLKATQKAIVVIEPGTPLGFSRILKVRKILISLNGHLIAPCPHRDVCPLASSDWCHFSERLERSSSHRKIKKGELGYEDEKFSYVVFSKQKLEITGSRLIRRPQKLSKQVRVTLCTKSGIENKVISKGEKEIYHKARKADWGSLLNLNSFQVE